MKRQKARLLVPGLGAALSLTLFVSACGGAGSQEDGSNEGNGGEPARGGALRVAISGDPVTLDAHLGTATLTAEVSSHTNEGLFTMNCGYEAVPMLADSYSYDEDRKTYQIKLRTGITFHDGSDFGADDVVASLERWTRLSNMGKTLAGNLKAITKVDDATVDIELVRDSPVVPMFLAFPNQQAAIYPSEIVDAAGDQPITDFIGTGPYKLEENAPGQHLKLVRWDGYVSRDESPDCWAGAKHAYADEISFIPQPEIAVRLNSLLAGEVDVAQELSTDMMGTLEGSPDVVPEVPKPDASAFVGFNMTAGPTTDQRLRQAILAALDMDPIMTAAFTSPDFYRLDPGILPPESTAWWSDAGTDVYDRHDLDAAKSLLEESDYSGEPLVMLATKEYPFSYTVATVVKDQLEELGVEVDLQVSDFATLLERRSDPNAFSMWASNISFTPDPGLWAPFDGTWGGKWTDPHKDALVEEINTTMDPSARKAAFEELQSLYWDQVPLIKVGDYFGLSARSKRVEGYTSTPFPFFWNTSVT